MKKITLLPLLMLLVSTFANAALTDEEKKTEFGKRASRSGIYEDQWDYYSAGWAAQSGYPIPDNWIQFRNDNWTAGVGTSAAYKSYVAYVNAQVNNYINQPNIPIDGGLGFLLAAGLGFGLYKTRRKFITA